MDAPVPHQSRVKSLDAPTSGRTAELRLRIARHDDLRRLQEIRSAAFAPVFASFRSILGDEIYDLAQRHEDEGQAALLESLLAAAFVWTLYVAQLGSEMVGFVAVRLDRQTHVGEIGLNAVDPQWQGQGIGTAMYRFGMEQMKQSGMRVATVATGGDPSHGAARRAYRRAGFDVEIPSVCMCSTL